MKILWNVMIQYEREIKTRKPEVVVVNKNEKSCAIIDIAISENKRVSGKEKEKIERTDRVRKNVKL